MTFAAFGLFLAVGVGLLWWATSNQVGEPPSPASARHTAQTTPDSSPPPSGSEAAPSTDTSARTTSPPGAADTAGESASPGASPDTAEALPASEPVRVSIPSIDVESPLHALGLADDGTLEVPSGERYDEAAWYSGSPTPGEAGPAVIEGHVTSQGSVPSVFFELGALETGDLVEVEREDGTTATFEVYGAQSFPKDEFPKATVYGNTEGPELRLITCGGTYDPARRAHLDNIVVFARMVP
ncbi:class F sortase [Ornithinimicrobium cryptoxanthini]|uniref:class F sortase n=1 Tax=Ornithinimicrobium cryptoxanthini TaxID=2934161 RepID=UPI002119970A|nr:class F sortase [Ornithinimicrobium cryptoxanthini]